MTSGRVLVTTAWLRPGDAVDRYLREAGLEVSHSSFKDRAETGERLADLVGPFDAIVAGTDPFDREVLAAAPRLRVIGRTGVGYDNIDVAAATERGVAVCPTPGVNRQSVAEHTIGLLLSAARTIPQNVAGVRAGAWDQVSGRELGGAVLGVVGLGAIGRLVATMAQGLGMSVVAYDPYFDHAFAEEHGIREAGLDELLAEADFVSLHLFLTPETHRLIDAAAIDGMKDGAFLVNAARGGVVDEDALADALTSGKLAGAALDTVEVEPLPADSRLRGIDNLLITAHIGAATVESRARSGKMAARSVVDGLQGRIPPQTVNPECAAARTAA
ncbi:phosphoglycerate dehydrogenase [Glycomyces harbinensis]|uniref:D-3-phosphoglycerate dehydrogenase/(S)-sulfolactate dehydrogenase n=1 Tax=Glycomyces harbinensis TaxID=58114 RepID=A0A1G6W0W7_9ACTN|nr:phosphoglycerate dehydrogenase [Glycomyces harbinensis]SDD59438.1 D-3-phosphoglycerate dehydrogenase/(S)-sulfolactate dehydrogenase [Glycomyces harbinensis]